MLLPVYGMSRDRKFWYQFRVKVEYKYLCIIDKEYWAFAYYIDLISGFYKFSNQFVDVELDVIDECYG